MITEVRAEFGAFGKDAACISEAYRELGACGVFTTRDQIISDDTWCCVRPLLC